MILIDIPAQTIAVFDMTVVTNLKIEYTVSMIVTKSPTLPAMTVIVVNLSKSSNGASSVCESKMISAVKEFALSIAAPVLKMEIFNTEILLRHMTS